MESSCWDELLKEKNIEQVFECSEKTFGFQLLKSDAGWFLCFDEEVFGPFMGKIQCIEKLAKCYLLERNKNFDRYVEIHKLAQEWGKE